MLGQVFRPVNTTVIHGDDMHRWERGNENWLEFTHLNPKANYLHQELRHLALLKEGRRVLRRSYDHANGQFVASSERKANKLVIFEGLHAFYLEKMRELYDLRIFISPERELLEHWKIVRDHHQRGHSQENIRAVISSREADRETFIAPQAKYADILIEVACAEPLRDPGSPELKPQLYYRLRFNNSVYLEPLLQSLETIDGLTLVHQLCR